MDNKLYKTQKPGHRAISHNGITAAHHINITHLINQPVQNSKTFNRYNYYISQRQKSFISAHAWEMKKKFLQSLQSLKKGEHVLKVAVKKQW